MNNPVGIYEKALPKDLSWAQRFEAASHAGYDFLEMSVDETPERMARLDWTLGERLAFFKASRSAVYPCLRCACPATARSPLAAPTP